MDAGTGWRHCFPFQGGRYRDRSGRTYRQGPLRQHRVAVYPAEHDHDDLYYACADYNDNASAPNDDYACASDDDYTPSADDDDYAAPADYYNDHVAAADDYYNDHN